MHRNRHSIPQFLRILVLASVLLVSVASDAQAQDSASANSPVPPGVVPAVPPDVESGPDEASFRRSAAGPPASTSRGDVADRRGLARARSLSATSSRAATMSIARTATPLATAGGSTV